MRNIVASVLVAGALTGLVAPAQAAGKDCASEMKRVEAAMPANQDAGKSAMARAELKIAAEKAAKKDEQGCMTHVGNAEKAMK
ncbi:hypothetical protein MOX02_36300 [Methylobacterium oxalidis]|uniref:Uncharacterized protein n=1 Tax=Methylobacterium oxalidis TaxID=944322 RepID=A0A512J6R7_9HYPH|nr:hypothetical protein MOX02_36300 [Methylobacterium oxalidis]GJE35902.1 hypothetical protein LDDCCGHA_6123 [Methylobacterium oxalidis]GLS65428.1 hypothetical protein GCM10007888_38100 [Methylobacterium oxalidis]